MAIRLVDEYPNRTGGATTSYPHGSSVNRSAPGADDGTPLEQKWVNDVQGFIQALIDTPGIAPSGNPETAVDSQYYQGLLHAARGMTEVDVGGSANVTLQTYDSRTAVVRLFGTLTADIDVIVPDTARFYLFINETDGDFAVTVKTSGGTGFAVRKGNSQWLYSDGTNVKRIQAVADQEYAGTPNGNLAAETLYQRAWDTSKSPAALYVATTADGTIAGTTWTSVIESDVEAASLLRGHINGLEVANNATDPDHDIDVATGTASVDDGAGNRKLVKRTSGLTKLLDVEFAEGDAAGGFAAGEALPVEGTIHIWLIAKDDGTTDVFANDHATSGLNPTLPSGFTRKRRIGSRTTDGFNNIIQTSQNGDEVLIVDPPLDVDVVDLSDGLFALSVPEGLKLPAKINTYSTNEGGAGRGLYVSSPDVLSESPSQTSAPLASSGVWETSGTTESPFSDNPNPVRTDQSARIRITSTGADQDVKIATLGWIDTRGRDA